MNTLLNEMQRYLQVIERAEADPEVWGKLTEGTGIATANSYRAALAAAQPVAPEQAPTAAMVRKIMHEELAALSENATPCDDDEILLTKSSERIAARLASQQVKGYSVDEVRQAMMLMWADCGPNVKTVEAKQKASVILASLSAKGEAAHPSFDVIDKYGATHLIEKVPGTEVELSHLRHDQSVVSGDSKTFHYRLTKVDVDKGEAPKEKYGAVVRAEDGAPYDALAELIKRGIKLARLRADIKSDVEDAFYSQTVAIEIDGVRTTAVTHERFNRMLNVLYDRWLPRSTPAAPEGTVSAPVEEREGARPPFEKFEDTDLVSIATVKGWFAAAPSGVVEALPFDLKDLLRIRNYFGENDKTPFEHWAYGFLDRLHQSLSAAPKEGEQPEPTNGFKNCDYRNRECTNTGEMVGGKWVCSNHKAAPKPNPEPLVAALKKTNKGLDVIVGSLAKNGQLASASLLAQLKHDNAATLTQWEASQPSPDSPKN